MTWDLYLFLKCAGIAVFVFWGGQVVSRNLGIPCDKAFFINAAAVFAAFAGSRAWYVIQHIYGGDPYEITGLWDAWENAGSVLYGWVIGGTLMLVILTRALKLSTIRYLDTVLPILLVAQFLNRMGCFDAGCCYGSPSVYPFPFSVAGDIAGERVWPVQLYEALFDLALFAFIMTRRDKRPGYRTFLYFTGYPIARFFFEFLRGDNGPAALGLTVPQLTSVLLVAFAFWKLRPAPTPRTTSAAR